MKFILACILLCSWAVNFCSAGDPNDPTNFQKVPPCYFQIRLNSLEKVDGVTKTFEADFYLMAAFPLPGVLTSTINNTNFIPMTNAATMMPGVDQGMFNFNFDNSNDYELITQSDFLMGQDPAWMHVPPEDHPDDVMIIPNNTFVTFFRYRRYKGVFKSSLPLHDFPFDRQQVRIDISINVPSYGMRVVPKKTQKFTNAMEGLLQWTKKGEETLENTMSMEGIPEKFSGVRFQVSLQRLPNYYYLKIISGITMVVFMNLLLFALDTKDSNRIAVSATLFLAIVAYLFLVSNDVPKVAYATRLDNFVLLSMIDIFISTILFTCSLLYDRAAEKAREDADEEWEANRVKAYNEPPTASSRRNPIDNNGSSDDDDVSENKHTSPTRGSNCGAEEKRPKNKWFDTWQKKKHSNDIFQVLVVGLLFIIGAPVILWG